MSQANLTNENSKPSVQSGEDKENASLPKEMLEDQYLKGHKKEDEKDMSENVNEKEENERYQRLLNLLECSTKITSLLEIQFKKHKSKIIQKELEKKQATETTNNKLNEESSTSETSCKPNKKKSAKTTNKVSNEGNSVETTYAISNEGTASDTTQNKSSDDVHDENYYLNLFEQPKLFNGHLKNHQIEGLLWIRTLYENGVNGILADDMGLGKTIQTIAFYCFLIEKGVPGPFLVIAPLSTIPNWLSEFEKFSSQLSTLLYYGNESERIALRSKFSKITTLNNLRCLPIVITTYEVVRNDIKALKTVGWKFITIDEGHKLKNVNAQISKCMRQLSSNKLILTGTPIQNDMSELWSLLNLLMPDMFKNLDDFNQWFVIENFFDSNDKIANMAKKNEILNTMLKIIKPFILRREKKDTDLNLPPKKEIVIYAPVTEVQHNLYKATINKHIEILLNTQEDDNTENGVLPKRKCVERIRRYTESNALFKDEPEKKVEDQSMAISVIMQNSFIQLKKIANHPYLVHMPLIPNTKTIRVDEDIIKFSGKFQVLDAMLTKLKLLGHKVLLFSTMVQILDLIEEFLIFRSYSYTRLDGQMRIQPRVDAMKSFNTDPNCFVMMISTRAGGLGLNLTSADTVIIFDSDWNPQCDLQAQDRCHRMGQNKSVVVYRLCSKNTVDEKILQRATAKRKLEKMMMGNGSFNMNNQKMGVHELEELIKLLESSECNKTIQSNGFIFTDEELDALLDRSDMLNSSPSTNVTKSAEHFKVLATS